MAAAATVASTNNSPMPSHQRITPNVIPQLASSSRSPPRSSVSPPLVIDTSPRAFNRLRSSLEQSIRTATRIRKSPTPDLDDFATLTVNNVKGKGKEGLFEENREKMNVFGKLGSKVTFRRARRESTTSPVPPPPQDKPHERERVAGNTSYVTPSLRLASLSSPALHLSSQALPSPKSQPLVPASSSSGATALVSPSRQRVRRSSLQPSSPLDISGPAPLAMKRDRQSSGQTPSRHRSTKPNPPELPKPITIPNTPHRPSRDHDAQNSQSSAEMESPPDTPTPISRAPATRAVSSRPSTAHTGTPSVASRPVSPHTRPLTRTRVVIPVNRGLTSTSTTHLPTSGLSPSHRASIDAPRRPSIESPRRPSIDSPRRVSVEAPKRSSRDSPVDSRANSPSPVRPRPVSPAQRSYAQNRHFGVSSGSLLPPYNPEHREQIRKATTMICKEMVKPPPHMVRSEQGSRDWDEVERRMNSLARMERIWGMSGINSGSNLNISISGISSTTSTATGEERERRTFCEALRDGFVLCQLMNKIRSSTVVRPDPREDGFVKTSNVTKFLAACASYGLVNEDLFQRDDLIEATSESLARVAYTIITLMQFVETPAPSRIKWIKPSSPTFSGPYMKASSGRGSASTPNLIPPLSTSPTPASPRKRYSPPSGLPALRSDEESNITPRSTRKPNSATSTGSDAARGQDVEVKLTPVPPILKPPPKSPLRARSVKRQQDRQDNGLSAWAKSAASPSPRSGVESTRASLGDTSFLGLSSDNNQARQSIASTAVTDTTMTTQVSSILDNHGYTGGVGGHNGNKYGTIRTVTTDVTSEVPSMTRAEGNMFADELAKAKLSETPPVPPAKFGGRERNISGAHAIDLTRVAEETDESTSSNDKNRKNKEKGRGDNKEGKVGGNEKPVDKIQAIHLHKAKWPDDFMDAFQMPKPSRLDALLAEDLETSYTPLSTSPPTKKLAIVGAGRRAEGSNEPLGPRRPTHLARHSVDTTPSGLLPKESIFRRDTSPEGSFGGPSRLLLRRTSIKTQSPRTGSSLSNNSPDDPRNENNNSPGVPVPFPRAVSGEHSGTPSPRTDTPVSNGSATNGAENAGNSSDSANEKPRLPRGRFQSEINGSSRLKARPSSYDGMGVKPSRTRFESMVNLGGNTSGMASASDLMTRDSMDGSAVRKTLIIREEGKPPTHFQLGNCIGRGQFGSVYRALNLNTGQMVAVKRIRLEGLKEDEISTLMREVDLVKSLSHPSIVKYEGMARDEDTLSIVLEYAENGSLAHTLKAFGKLNERLVASYVLKILEGLHYLHQSDVVHCDLKAANILTTKNGNVKLSDFGVSLNLRAMERQNDVAGTPNWMAPEVIELKGASTKSDIWSLACTVVELLTGKPPYSDITNSMTVMFRIVEDVTPPIPDGCSDLLQDFFKQCFHKDASKRPSAGKLFEHPWLKKNWAALNDLRPQDSLPFIRRVSQDLQKSDMARYLSKLDKTESPITVESPRWLTEDPSNTPPVSPASPVGQRMSNSSIRPLETEFFPREHNFVKTTFSKPVICRVCLENVKKTAVLCAQCSLISHSKCAPIAPPTCDLRSQLLLYAQYAEKGNPNSLYSNPLDTQLDIPRIPAAMSDVPYVSYNTPQSSVDTYSPIPPLSSSPTQVHPPTAFKFMAAFRRSRSNLLTESHPTSPASEPDASRSPTRELERSDHSEEKTPVPRKRPAVLQKRSKERPRSYTSNSTGLSSLRSAATAANSTISSNQTEAGQQSQLSGTDVNADRHARFSTNVTSSSHDDTVGPKKPRKDKDRTTKKSTKTSSAASDAETNDIAERSTASSVIPGGMSVEPTRRARGKRDSNKQQGGSNCLLQ